MLFLKKVSWCGTFQKISNRFTPSNKLSERVFRVFLEFSYVKDDRNAFEANLKDNEKRRTDISYQLYDLQEVVDEQTVGFYSIY